MGVDRSRAHRPLSAGLRLATALAVLAVLGPPTPAAATGAVATPTDPLTLALTADAEHYTLGAPITLTAAVTNATGSTCAIPTTPDATLRVAAVTRDGDPLTPVLGRTLFERGSGEMLRASLEPTDPGEAATVTRTAGPWGGYAEHAVLRDYDVLPAGDALHSLWLLDAPGRYEVDVRFEVLPLEPDDGACAGGTDIVTVAFTIGEAAAPFPWLAVVGGLMVLLLGAAVAWVVLRTRRRRRAAVGVALVLVLTAGWTAATPSAPAQALIRTNDDATPEFRGRVDACLRLLGDPSRHTPETQPFIDWALDPDTPPITIQDEPHDSRTGDTPDSPHGRGSSIVSWNSTSTTPYPDGSPRDPCTALFHELVHAQRFGDRSAAGPADPCGSTDIPEEEVHATLIENIYRIHNGIPPRTEYDGRTLPESIDDCDEPDPERPPGPERITEGGAVFCEDDAPCAESTGDPHLQTFDGARFSPQAVGEVVLVRSADGGFEVQARQSPLGPSRWVSVNSVVAVRAGEHRVVLTLEPAGIAVHVDGEPLVIDRGSVDLPGGAVVERGPSSRRWAPDSYTVTAPDGSAVQVDPIAASGLRLQVRLAEERAAAGVTGLLGDADGDPTDDHTTRDGQVLPRTLDDDQLYGELVESWRVADEESLFDYADGESTQTFTDRTFPDARLTAADLAADDRSAAEAVCAVAGVRDERLLAECVLDVAASGVAAFAVTGGHVQADHDARTDSRSRDDGDDDGDVEPAPVPEPERLPFTDDVTVLPLTGDEATVALDRPGAVAQVTFDAASGETVLIELTGATLPDGCGFVGLVGPAGDRLASSCLDDGSGVVDRTVLADAGTHTVVVDPPDDAVGQVVLHLHRITDEEVAVDVGGAPAEVAVTQPGGHGRVAFDGRAGQEVTVEVSGAGMLDGCGFLRLEGVDGPPLGGACVSGGTGRVAAVLPADGRHVVVLDPPGLVTGSARVAVG